MSYKDEFRNEATELFAKIYAELQNNEGNVGHILDDDEAGYAVGFIDGLVESMAVIADAKMLVGCNNSEELFFALLCYFQTMDFENIMEYMKNMVHVKLTPNTNPLN